MNTYLVKQSALQGELHVPPSKSQTLRAILFAAMAQGKSVIHDYLSSTDSQAMIEACRLLGAKVDVTSKRLDIQGLAGSIHCAEDVIHAHNSGIVLRFCAALGALSSHPIVITGDHSIRYQRPIKPLLDGLKQLGVSAKTMRGDDHAPVIIQGPICSGKATINGEDSQPVSGLLIASAFAQGPVEITVKNPGEKPWVNLTLNWFDRLGIAYEQHDFQHYRLPGKSNYQGFEYTVPGDFSSAAFPIAAALITQSELLIKNIDMRDAQGDKELIRVLQEMGAVITYDEPKQTLHIAKGTDLKGVKVDINNFVDAITILAVVACFAEGETHIYNGAIAKHKECNRIHGIVKELQKMGADIKETHDGLVIRRSHLHGASLHSHADHRMAMSLVVAAMGAKGESSISSVECISKTYPSFLSDFKLLGVNMMESKDSS